MPALARPAPWRLLQCGLLTALLALGALCGGARQIVAQVPPADVATVTVKAPQAILMDVETGSIIFQRAADDLLYPANMSKLMLLAVVFKALKAGEIKLEDEYFMSE